MRIFWCDMLDCNSQRKRKKGAGKIRHLSDIKLAGAHLVQIEQKLCKRDDTASADHRQQHLEPERPPGHVAYSRW